MVTQGQNYITGKKITLPKMKAKNTRTDTLRGITGKGNLSVLSPTDTCWRTFAGWRQSIIWNKTAML
jgi:hypothetical protein